VTVTREILRLLAAANERGRAELSLSALAALAFRSRFNLHRAFRSVVGETPKAYTTRVRLARAAADLLADGDRSVSAVAFAHGFASHEVFTRAFTRAYGLSPRAYRTRGLRAADDRAARINAATAAAAAPCVGLYRMTTENTAPPERSNAVPVDVVVKDLPEMHALVMRRRTTRDEIAATLGEFLPAVFAYAQKNGLALTGPPFARYPEVGMGTLVLEAGFTVAELPTDEPGDGMEKLTIPAGPAAVAVHYGPYDRLPETYREIEAWIEAEGRTAAGPPRETYLTDPGERPDPLTWETEIVQPLA
jgi:AraC family transcriptional regulator